MKRNIVTFLKATQSSIMDPPGPTLHLFRGTCRDPGIMRGPLQCCRKLQTAAGIGRWRHCYGTSLATSTTHHGLSRTAPCLSVSRRRLCQAATNEGEARNINPAAMKQSGVLYLDTLAMAKHLESQGFTQQQAETLTKAFLDVITTGLEHQTKVMVTKPQQEIMVQQLLAQIASVKKDMVILEKSEFTMIRNDTEKQSIRISQLESRMDDELKKLGGQVKLDINLEKSRAIEAHANNETELQGLLNRIEVEHANHEKDMKALENKIDIDVSNLRTQSEKNRNDVQKYFLGIAVSAATLYLGYLRLVS